tara:strand:- start:868 stop:1305 length:438 start_codon:yes stop_codon:yes gene_type:complete
MTTLANYNIVRTAKIKAIESLYNALAGTPLAREIVATVKSLEILGDLKYVPSDATISSVTYSDLLTRLAEKASNAISLATTADEMMYLSRGIAFSEVPFFDVAAWKIKHHDSENVDIHGEIAVGERTFESFESKVLETFYATVGV